MTFSSRITSHISETAMDEMNQMNRPGNDSKQMGVAGSIV